MALSQDMQFYKYQGTGNDFVMLDDRQARWDLANIQLVQALWREGFACSSGSACSSSGSAASAVLLAMGYETAAAAAGLRISLGPWHGAELLEQFPQALERARAAL